ncbi:MAG: peptidoglycan DD-metalloendopeptidase family protein [Desulfuromusa sp.]|nr:peptidoglycan DD-metalloendopeptidase family protein [Desulfuromusa sp.]
MISKQDFQPPRYSVKPRKHKSKMRQMVMLTLLVLFVGVALLLLSSGPSTELAARETPIVVSSTAVLPAPPEPVREETNNTVPAGSSITALLGNYFTAQEIYNLDQQSDKIFPFTKIIAGQPYRICTIDGQFSSFIYEIDAEEQLLISREAEQINMERQLIQYDVTTELVQGTITSSLFEAVQEIGEDSKFAFLLADIFAWDIDFILDLRVGDTFQALVEKRYREGLFAGYGHILAAEFINREKIFRAVRFENGDQRSSYYNEVGENVRKAFLKAPVSFTRISSGYTMKRLHPITKTWKAHPAIDYVAPVGTPIKTVGDGSISRIGYTSGNGNFVEVRHSNGYSTLYLHMRGFARGMKRGKRVTQGQVIGYLGGTGMATGPHLCFRMRLNGAPVNPTKLRVPAAKSVSKEHLAEFQAFATPLLTQLNENRERTYVAKLDLSSADSVSEKAD